MSLQKHNKCDPLRDASITPDALDLFDGCFMQDLPDGVNRCLIQALQDVILLRIIDEFDRLRQPRSKQAFSNGYLAGWVGGSHCPNANLAENEQIGRKALVSLALTSKRLNGPAIQVLYRRLPFNMDKVLRAHFINTLLYFPALRLLPTQTDIVEPDDSYDKRSHTTTVTGFSMNSTSTTMTSTRMLASYKTIAKISASCRKHMMYSVARDSPRILT